MGHGMSFTPTYGSWETMIRRCNNKNDGSYPRYGGRGIAVCERWLKFDNFLFDMGERPEGMTLDRIDSNGHYEPGNCRWATPKQQQRNTSRNHMVSAFGETRPVSAWVEDARCRVIDVTLRARLRASWEPEKAITEPAEWRGKDTRQLRRKQ